MDSERYVSFSISDLYPEWQDDAHCRGVGHDYYFGEEDELPPKFIAQIRRASKLCDVCPVFRECLTHALTVREEYGVWAGTSRRGRKKLFSRIDQGESVDKLVEEVRSERKGEEVRELQPTVSRRGARRGSSEESGGGSLRTEASG